MLQKLDRPDSWLPEPMVCAALGHQAVKESYIAADIQAGSYELSLETAIAVQAS